MIKLAEISAANPVAEYIEPFVHGNTTLSGELLKIGGAEPRATLRDDIGILHSIKVDPELAKLLGTKLYESISLECEALWNTETWAVVEASAIRFLDQPTLDPVDAFEELRKRVQGAWDGIDVEDHFKLERGED